MSPNQKSNVISSPFCKHLQQKIVHMEDLEKKNQTKSIGCGPRISSFSEEFDPEDEGTFGNQFEIYEESLPIYLKTNNF